MRLLAAGRIADAAALVTLAKKSQGGRGRSAAEEDAEEAEEGGEGLLGLDGDAEEAEAEDDARDGLDRVRWTSLTWGEARTLVAEYLSKQPKACEARRPAHRRWGKERAPASRESPGTNRFATGGRKQL